MCLFCSVSGTSQGRDYQQGPAERQDQGRQDQARPGGKTVKAKTAAEKNKNQKKQTARVTGTERANQLAGKVDLEDNNARAARLTKIRESITVDDY